MSRALDVVTLTGEEYDALTQQAEDWYALYAAESKKRAKLREALEPFAAIDLLECRLPPEFAMWDRLRVAEQTLHGRQGSSMTPNV